MRRRAASLFDRSEDNALSTILSTQFHFLVYTPRGRQLHLLLVPRSVRPQRWLLPPSVRSSSGAVARGSDGTVGIGHARVGEQIGGAGVAHASHGLLGRGLTTAVEEASLALAGVALPTSEPPLDPESLMWLERSDTPLRSSPSCSACWRRSTTSRGSK
ncbi:hypothetical protein GQ600_22222 [Phytophthora cactorum]|nr:hypothetical protein GQ600_22222 [Phytophthora cactorum]